jgi:hypothetical protein
MIKGERVASDASQRGVDRLDDSCSERSTV